MMTLEELLQTPLMRNAQVIAGHGGLSREVTWCVPNTALRFDNAIMPGLLLLVTEREDDEHIEAFLDKVEDSSMSGVAFFEAFQTGDEMHENAIKAFDKRSIPLIKLPRNSNPVTFMKRFVAAYSTHFSEEFRREEWLHELCYGSGLTGGETIARSHGYNPDRTYSCAVLTMRDTPGIDPTVREMESGTVRAFIVKALSLSDARVLTYISERHVVAFVPWADATDSQAFRDKIVRAITDMRRAASSYKWQVVVGSHAHSLAEFHSSYLGALRTQEVVEMLDVHEKASFYDDWYMHMLLLKEPRPELREHMSHALAPILDSPDLLETLTNYLVFGENLKETAEKTFIHVNTLKYRLKRIQELLGVDLRDPNARFRLRMAITIERYLRD